MQVGFRKLKRKNGSSTTLSTSTAAPQWGLANYLPKMPEAEDVLTIAKNRKWMQEERQRSIQT